MGFWSRFKEIIEIHTLILAIFLGGFGLGYYVKEGKKEFIDGENEKLKLDNEALKAQNIDLRLEAADLQKRAQEIKVDESPTPSSSDTGKDPSEVSGSSRRITVAEGQLGTVGGVSITVHEIKFLYRPVRYQVSVSFKMNSAQDLTRSMKLGDSVQYGGYEIQLTRTAPSAAQFLVKDLSRNSL